ARRIHNINLEGGNPAAQFTSSHHHAAPAIFHNAILCTHRHKRVCRSLQIFFARQKACFMRARKKPVYMRKDARKLILRPPPRPDQVTCRFRPTPLRSNKQFLPRPPIKGRRTDSRIVENARIRGRLHQIIRQRRKRARTGRMKSGAASLCVDRKDRRGSRKAVCRDEKARINTLLLQRKPKKPSGEIISYPACQTGFHAKARSNAGSARSSPRRRAGYSFNQASALFLRDFCNGPPHNIECRTAHTEKIEFHKPFLFLAIFRGCGVRKHCPQRSSAR